MTYKLLFLAVLTLMALMGCSFFAPKTDADISVKTLKEWLDQKKDITLLDVRTPEEWQEGVIKQTAIQLDFYSDDFSEKLADLDPDKTTVVYCAKGGRSAKAFEILKEKGFKEVYNLEGGIGAWTAKGYALD